jgi:hypothetical protein
MVSCLALVMLVFALKLPPLKSGLWLLVGGFALMIASNLVVARAGRFAHRWAVVLWPLMPLALASFVAGGIVLSIAGLLWLWAAIV